ncbi:MAG: DegQ family serine endoprotease [Sedimentisphaerales bacterium]
MNAVVKLHSHNHLSRLDLTLVSFVVFSLILPVSAFGEDEKSIDTLRQLGRAFSQIAEKASPAVVAIKAEKKVTISYPQSPFGNQPLDPFSQDFFQRFFQRQSPQQQQQRRSPSHESLQIGQGSGFIVSPDGYILTNNHLVGDVDEVKVTLTDGRDFVAKIIGTDPESDVAVIKIDANNLSCLEMADSDKIEVGEWVLAIGNPFGLSHTVTAGIISAKGRSGFGIAAFEDFIQTDAAINMGNSGGPLVNLDGKVVGINTALISSSPGMSNVGVGLAIPINIAKPVYKQIVAKGAVTRGWLGVAIADLTPDKAKQLDINEAKGVLVPEVMVGSPAAKAGVQAGDIIVEMDGKMVDKAGELQRKIALKEPGKSVELVVIRDGSRKTITVKLEKRPSKEQLEAGRGNAVVEKLGITVQNLTEDAAKQYGYEDLKGVLVTNVEEDSPAAAAGIEPGCLIQEVNRKPVANTRQFNDEIQKSVKTGRVMMLIRYENRSIFVVLTIPQD